ncbi:MAG TPA: hypothetical protein IGS37_01740 [Synechococcales cyanobacterium M55_K2018_004]|nr:hypothetical protein [Synechococcales cyanobacterium M55_K2018_004]
MVHTFEVMVDVKEYSGESNSVLRTGTTRYEIDAESRSAADSMARLQAKHDYPHATEFDIRVTRFLK